MGLVKLLLGLFAAPFAQEIFNAFPKNLLGVMVVAAGLELVGVGVSLNTTGALDLRHQNPNDGINDSPNGSSGDKGAQPLSEDERKRRWTIMAITIGGMLAFHNDAIGFLAGMLCHWSFQLQDHFGARRAEREGQIRLNDDSLRGDIEALPASLR